MDRSEGERRAAGRPGDQPETERKRPGRASNPQRDNINLIKFVNNNLFIY